MGIADRARDAMRPTNSIEEVQEPTRRQPQTLHGASPAAVPTSLAAGPQAPQQGSKKPSYAAEPEGIAKAYYMEDRGSERRYYEDYKRQTLAMRATESTVSTKRDDLNTIKAMFEVAGARGWTSVDVKGSAEFKREAWIEGQARGLDVRGHRASDPDRQEADRRRAERGSTNELRATLTAPVAPSAPVASVAPAAPVAPANTPAIGAEPPRQKASQPPKEAPSQGRAAGEPSASVDDNRRTLRDAQRELSPDGRTMLAAMTTTIDRQMAKLTSEAKAELKAFAASELVKKERVEGPIVLSHEQKQAAKAPEPVTTPARRIEPEAPRRSMSR